MTRYLVDTDAGVPLTCVTQNHSTADDLADRGDRVRLVFARRHCRRLDGPPGDHTGLTDPGHTDPGHNHQRSTT